jgi:phosphoglycerol transferase MdoB-like AlkP superfamily enzyme
MFVKIVRFMAVTKGTMGVFARVRSLLTRGDWVYLASLLVPLVVYNVVLKVIRIFTLHVVPGPLGFLDQVRSDLLFNLGYMALWVGIFAVVRGRWARLVSLVAMHVSVVMVVVLTTSAHFFYEKTGSTLDWGFVVVSVSSLGEIQGVIGSETTPLHWILVSIGLLYTIIGPTLMTRFATGDWRPAAKSAGQPIKILLTMCLAALLLFSLSVVPSVTNAGNAFARDPVANMVVKEVASPEVEATVPRDALPTDTRLVPTSDTEKRNVVVVFLESTRARSTTPYNEDLDTTPFLAELSEESLMAERAYAVVPHTSKALVATTCGVEPPLDTDKTESEPGILPAQCLPDLLKDHGYQSKFFQSATKTFERRPQLVKNFGYDTFTATEGMNKEGFDKANYFGYEDDIMLEPSRAWLEENGYDGPFLTTYLTVTPHHDYVVPDRYGKKLYSENDVLNRYLNTVRYQDFFLKNLFAQYKELGLYEDTIFVILGDHGEGFGEHGLKQHDNTIYDEGLHIPLLIHDPRRPESRRIEAPVNELDVLPTLADLLGYRIGGGLYPGTSILSAPEDRTLMASCYHEQTCLASMKDGEKYIYSYGNRGEEYYDLSEDPNEQNNLIADQNKKKIDKLRNDLLAWEARVESSYDHMRPDEATPPAESGGRPSSRPWR